MDNDKNNEAIQNSLQNSPAPAPISKREIKRMKKKMSRKERRHTDFPGDPVKGRAFHSWAKFFFVLTCIGVGITGAMLILPFFLVLFGICSVLLWFCVVAFATIFTIGLIWTTEGMQTLNANWMAFNEALFDVSNNTYSFAAYAIPGILISGGIIIFATWLFLIVGINSDPERKKKYKAKIIAMIIFTVLYVVFLVLNLIRMTDVLNQITGSSASSL